MSATLPPAGEYRVLCVVVDRIQSGMLGPYGNSWVSTSAIDQLASQSLVLDNMISDGPALDDFYAGAWWGRPTVCDTCFRGSSQSLPNCLSAMGWETHLLTDESQLLSLPGTNDFDHRQLVQPTRRQRIAENPAQTQLARLFRELIESLSNSKPGQFWWVHLRGMAEPWDAPAEYRAEYVENDDALTSSVSPLDPDDFAESKWPAEQLPFIKQLYASQLTLLDECLGELFASLAERGALETTLIMLGSCRGLPMGAQGDFGLDDCPHEELVHVPWAIRLPERVMEPARSSSLAIPVDIPATIINWLQYPAKDFGMWGRGIAGNSEAGIRDRVCMRGPDDIGAIRTDAWHLIFDLKESPHVSLLNNSRLYVKPDDRWEFNNVVTLCPQIAEQLIEAYYECSRAGSAGQLSRLPRELVHPGAFVGG